MIEDSIWWRCFWEVYDKVKAEGKPNIDFDDVDKLVIAYSKMEIRSFHDKFFKEDSK